MLQQTRVAAVIPYYQRFLERFPTIEALANTNEQDLLAAWSGLGYYSRARNLQSAAKKVQDAGAFPSDYESIHELPGVGNYTAAAIASIAFDCPHAVVDGNVLRVLSRLTAEKSDLRSLLTRKRLQETADHLLHRDRPGEFNQAVMELGATVCLPRNPQCLLCPIAEYCEARRLGIQQELPIVSKRAVPERAEKELLLVERAGRLLFWQRPPTSQRLAGFWELPESEHLPNARIGRKMGSFRHTIVNTYYQVLVFRAEVSKAPSGFYWKDTKCLHEIPLSTTSKKALACLDNLGTHAGRL